MSTDHLIARFRALYEASPTLLVRAPGRVNLIGEHIDYSGRSVLPMAIQRAIRITARPREDGRIRIASTTTSAGAREFELAETIDPFEPGDWGNYPKAAAQALCGRGGLGRPGGFDGLVTSDLPIAAGLSSSSALVVASALTLLASTDVELDPIELAGLLAQGERYVGVRGGGMDQAICLVARAGEASRIDFDPLRTSQIPVPDAWRIVVADSLERAEKSGPAGEIYNARTRESAAALRQQAAGAPLDETLQRRHRHINSETRRVEEAVRSLRESDLVRFGQLLVASHASLRDDYEVSTTTLDELVEIATSSGAAGARLTGAGLGGCAIAACSETEVDNLLGALRHEFYSGRELPGPLDDALFVARPSSGASVSRL